MSPDQLNHTPAITFTEEDRLIWREIEWYSIGTDGMYAYRAAGRRDAELMYSIQRCRKSLGLGDPRPMGWFQASGEFAPVPLPDLRSTSASELRIRGNM